MATLAELVDAEAPLEEVALAIAVDAHPSCSRSACLAQLDVMASALSRRDIDGLRRHVCGELGFAGDDDYDDPRSHLLDDVLTRRLGSPVALAVIWVAIGSRAGIAVEPIAFPGNFLVRCDGRYLDPFDGRELPRDALLEFATETLGDPREALASLEPVGPRTVAVRILQNLLRIHQARRDHAWALVTCDRLFDLTSLSSLLADRGAHALATGSVRAALADFSAYLDDHPSAPDAEQVRRVMRRAQQLLTPAS